MRLEQSVLFRPETDCGPSFSHPVGKVGLVFLAIALTVEEVSLPGGIGQGAHLSTCAREPR